MFSDCSQDYGRRICFRKKVWSCEFCLGFGYKYYVDKASLPSLPRAGRRAGGWRERGMC